MASEIKNENDHKILDSVEESVSASIISARIQTVGPYLKIHIALWTTVAVYLFTRGGMFLAAWWATLSALSVILLMLLSKRSKVSKQLLVNTYLGITVISLMGVGYLSSRASSTVPFQFPILYLIAAQLLGFRTAMSWFSLCLLAIYFTVVPPWQGIAHATVQDLDLIVSATVLSVSVVWICGQAERFFLKRTVYLQRLADSLTEKTRLLNLAEETAKVGHWLWSQPSGETHVSQVLSEMCSLNSDSEIKIEDLANAFDQEAASRFQNTLAAALKTAEPFSLELTITEDNHMRHFTCRGNCQTNEQGEVESIFGVIRDETDFKEVTQRLSRKAEELNELAIIDPLTGLTNRLQFRRVLNESVTQANQSQLLMALLVLDMDGFKEINDTLGHAVGDLVLQEAAKRISSIVRGNDVVSRLGGDEFTVILNNVGSVEKVSDIGQRIVAAIREPMFFDNSKLEVGASVGASFCPDDATSAEELFAFADTAMYEAKFKKAEFSLYESRMTEELVKRKQVESKLSGALDRNEFSVVYQPQYRIDDDKIIGFEALVRWNRDGTVISPTEFIPVLESSGKIIEVGQWILEQACEEAAHWYKLGFDVTVAVNISPVQFRDKSFYERVTATISSYDIPPSQIDLEITEGVIIHDLQRTSQTLARLKEFGCMISVDDFGTGYSSLAYLKEFPIDRLKIDRVFIKDYPTHDDGTIASSIVVLGLSLDMEVLAEGVETEAQLEFLRQQDCQFMQGFLNSGPVTAEECVSLLEECGEVLMHLNRDAVS